MKKILAIGTILTEIQYLVNSIPSSNEVSFADEINVLTSSKVINAARLMATNNKVDYFGYVGKDSQGKEALKNLISYCISTDNVSVISNNRTGSVLVLSDKKEGSAIVLDLAVNKLLNRVDKVLNTEYIRNYDYVYIATSVPPEALYKVIFNAKKAGVPVIMDTPNNLDVIDLSKLKGTAYLIPNRYEAGKLVKNEINSIEDAVSAANHLSKRIEGNVIITIDKDGCVFKSKEEKSAIHYKTQSSISGDSTGSGDIFRGVFVSMLIEKGDPLQSIKVALSIASESLKIDGVEKSVHMAILKLPLGS